MTALVAPPTPLPLSQLLREGSQAQHREAEGSPFATALAAGQVRQAAYTAYLRRLHVVYVALETVGAASAADPLVGAVLDPGLERRAALEADLDHWAGPQWRATDVRSAAARTYADRITSHGLRWGGAFVAHHYTRYLGDLSGGRVVGRMLSRVHDLEGGAGLAFYGFPAVPKPKVYKDGYRARLDAMALDVGAREAMLDEVKVAFTLNQALFEEVDALS
ncbi:heme oxygenase (biliverdin-producing) [Solicola sp. PLA-1-18]|uniref:biliverdin-producing heme oxygenase n=1 Tax=Solicola sp. PLA-1-18 TaxID=3380532 RepID=UPI003B7794AE